VSLFKNPSLSERAVMDNDARMARMKEAEVQVKAILAHAKELADMYPDGFDLELLCDLAKGLRDKARRG
jgi:hypothetical protein